MYYEDVFRALEKYHIRYVVVGGVAVVLHGFLRLTVDLDLIVHLEEKNLDIFLKTMKSLGYCPRIPVALEEFKDEKKREEWRKKKGMKVFSLFHPQKHVAVIDIFVHEPIRFGALYKERKTFIVEGVKIPVASLKHLKRLKKIAGRPQDKIDIKALDELERLRKRKYAKKKL